MCKTSLVGPTTVTLTSVVSLACQMTDNYTSEWYGTFKLSPDEPYPTAESPLYPPEIYTTYDPNWREFVGTELVQVVAEFEHLLGDDLVSDIENALAIGAVGEMRRNGTFPAGDNLIPAYTNPGYMRCLTVGWIGHRLNNQTFIEYANWQGTMLLDLFKANGSNTLGEYNAPTYYGMDMWAMGANIKYGPPDATFTKNAPYILTHVWEDVAAHYNNYLGNLVGPYDRAYTRDMTTHSSVLSMYWWGMFGREYGPQPPLGEADLLYDVSQGAAISLIMDTIKSYIPFSVQARLKSRDFGTQERFLNKTIREDLSTDYIRIATSWMSEKLMIGGEQITEEGSNRGKQFNPAIVHWASDPNHSPYPYIGFFSLYPIADTIKAVASKNKLSVSYPNATGEGTSSFQFYLSGIPPSWTLGGRHTIDGFDSLPCLDVSVTAPGLQRLPTVYGSQISDHWYYNITYVVPGSFSGIPSIDFDIAYIC